MARKTTKSASKPTYKKLSATEMKELAGKYSRSRDKRKARPKLMKKYGKVQTSKIVAMAKKMEAAAEKKRAKTTSTRKKTTSTRKKTTSTRAKTTSSRKPKKSPGRVKHGKKRNAANEKLAKAEFKKRKNALIAAYKRHKGTWAQWVGKCKGVALAKLVKDAAERSK